MIPFFSFDFSYKGDPLQDGDAHQPLITRKQLEECGMPLHLAGGAKLELFPYNTTVFYVRLENLADDNFDTNYKYYDDHEDDSDIDIIDDDDDEEDDEYYEDEDDEEFIIGNLT